jgi:hypothetical protein
MVTPIDAVRLHSTLSEIDFSFRARNQYPSRSEFEPDKHLSPTRGAILGLFLGGLMWAGLIAGFRAVLGL